MTQHSGTTENHTLARGHMREYLKQITYGGNDGIVTTFAIVAGFAGAMAEGVAEIGALAVLVFGLANLFADAVSMGLGEFLSTRSSHDLYHARRRAELDEIAADPARETGALAAIFERRGLSPADAAEASAIFRRNPQMLADLTITYGYGMTDPRGHSPALNGLVTFASFVVFGAAPLLPYFLMPPEPATFTWSLITSASALVALGVLRWRATGQQALRALGETLAVGATCGAVAYAVGWIVGG